MMIPALAFGLLALLPASSLARNGHRWTLWLSGGWLVLLALLLSGGLTP